MGTEVPPPEQCPKGVPHPPVEGCDSDIDNGFIRPLVNRDAQVGALIPVVVCVAEDLD